MGLCGMVHWCCTIKGVPPLDSQCPISICLTIEKIQSCLQSGRMKATAQSLCSILKSRPVQHPASLVCVSSCCPLLCFGIQAPSGGPRATWLLRPHGHGENKGMHCESAGHEQERTSLCSWGCNWELGFGMDQVLSQINFSNFHGLWMGLHS